MVADLLDISEDDARGLCELAGHDLAMARLFRECAESCEDGDLRNQFARSYSGAARSYRQTLAMKLRLKRALGEDARAAAAEAARQARADEEAARRERAIAGARRRGRILGPLERLVWDEYEADDTRDVLADIEARLDELDGDDLSEHALIAQLAREFELDKTAEAAQARGAEPAGDMIRFRPEPLGRGDPAESGSCPQATPQQPSEPLDFDSTPPPPEPGDTNPLRPPDVPPAGDAEAGSCPPPPPAPDDAQAGLPPPPPPPPDPPPEPYVPPWEKLRPGQRWPGSSGW